MGRAHASMGERLRTARIEKQWTQEYVAAEVGVEPVTYARWERGQHRPHPFYHNKLCSLFGKSAQELGLSGSDSTPNDGIGKGESDQQQEAAQSPLHIEEPPLDQAPDEVAAFGMSDLTSRLEAVMWSWLLDKNTHSAARYHELQARLCLEIKDNSMQDDLLTRRDALRRLAKLPIDYCGLTLMLPNLTRPAEEILATCASGIIACWYLRKGPDLTFANSSISKYIPTLEAITSQAGSEQRKSAADLLAQCFLLKAVLAWNITTPNEAVSFAALAQYYGAMAESPLLQITALRTKAAALWEAKQWSRALQAAEHAASIVEKNEVIPPLIRSYVLAGLATYQSHHGQTQEALRSIGMAHDTFFAAASNDAIPIWIDHSIGNMFNNEGSTFLNVGAYKKALASLRQIDEQYGNDPSIPLSCRVASVFDMVIVEVNRDDQPRDMEWCIARWTHGMQGAKVLQSKLRFSEAVQAYQAMRAAWPGETRIKELRDLIIQ
jgi:transcriptional regulator with XRE-family HTH domain/tetratricopeptide (TPR) repeat protein